MNSELLQFVMSEQIGAVHCWLISFFDMFPNKNIRIKYIAIDVNTEITKVNILFVDIDLVI